MKLNRNSTEFNNNKQEFNVHKNVLRLHQAKNIYYSTQFENNKENIIKVMEEKHGE